MTRIRFDVLGCHLDEWTIGIEFIGAAFSHLKRNVLYFQFGLFEIGIYLEEK